MSQFRFFLARFLLLSSIVVVIISMIIFMIPPDPNSYFQASVIKLNLLKTAPSPRIIIVGGSNVAFAIDSEVLEAHFGMPVINLGLHGRIGSSTYYELMEYIRRGDIVILMPEYLIFQSKEVLDGNEFIIAQWVEYDLGRLRFVEPKRVPNLVLTIAQNKATRRFASFLSGGDLNRGLFISENFNRQGDFIGHANTISPIARVQGGPYLQPGTFYREIYIFFEQLNQDAKAKGAVVYFEFPASRESNCKATGREVFEAFYARFQEWTTIPVLTDLDNVCFPNSYFFDSYYHLNGLGRQVMTQRIINDLEPYLP